jgi:methionyl-tRNA synthetase
MSKTFFVTTAIDYTNSPPHIGHAYEKVLADVIARYHRMKTDADGKREKVFFLTGVDQHGQKVQQSAAKAGVPPAEFVKEITQKFVDLWKKLDVKYDEWAETTSDRHKKVVQGILQRLWDEKDPTTGESHWIYKAKQAGYYSVRQEQFLTDKERGPDGEFGPEWGQVEFREEENYYFRLERHRKWLLDLIDERAEGKKPVVIPDFRQIELRNAVEKLNGDLCISRPKSRLGWGIELPFDKDYVNYVWFDALTNYISFAGYDPNIDKYERQPQDFRDRWENVLQIIGKDILVPAHGIYWLIMLHAIGFPDDQMPQLLVHGWWNLGGAKMSKSAGNVIDPFLLADKYGGDALRYYLMSDIVTGKDADFSEERLKTRYTADLANSLGNLLNRTVAMIGRYDSGRITKTKYDDKDLEWLQAHIDVIGNMLYPNFSGNYEFSGMLELILGRIREGDLTDDPRARAIAHQKLESYREVGIVPTCNFLIDLKEPWKLAKDPAHKAGLSAVLYTLAESLRIVAILISPVLPKTAHGIFDQLNWKMELSGKEERFSLADAEWGGMPDGHVVGKPVPLFPRIES